LGEVVVGHGDDQLAAGLEDAVGFLQDGLDGGDVFQNGVADDGGEVVVGKGQPVAEALQ
jgi:hypothetical protein